MENMVKIEVLCGACGHGYLLDESSLGEDGEVPCVGCGATIRVSGRKPTPPAPPASKGNLAEAVAPRPVEDPDPKQAAEKVVCPRCGLHFEPRKMSRDEASGTERKTVLVVEDMEYFLTIARDSLEANYEVRTATSVPEAMKALGEGPVDLMVLDLTLDGSDQGLRVLEAMQPKPCPIIVFTAQDEAEMYGEKWDELQALGADDLVLKGMNVGEALARKVAELLGDTWDENE